MSEPCIGPSTPTEYATSNTQGPDLCPLCMLHLRIKVRLGGWAASSPHTDTVLGRSSQEFRPRVCY
jgi:hypothetical protein